jgi:glycosyltransferase involved in cell wall biosynthesis
MTQPLVSIIMPVYNVERFLQEAVGSALQQTYTNWELILINDGSTDRTREICLSYTDPRIRYIENEQNMGVLRSRNRALEFAKGDYIAWLDSDDIAAPEKIAKQVAFLEANPDYVMCGTLHQDIDAEGKLLQKWLFPTEDRDLRSFLLLVNCFCNSSTIVRGDLMRRLKFAETFEVAEDYELWYRCSLEGRLANLPEFLTLYRVHGNNISITKKEKMFAIVKELAGRILTDIGLNYTPEELEIHNRLISFDGAFFKDPALLNQLETWIIKLYNHLITRKSYNNLLLFGLLAERWQVVCIQNGRYARVLFNRLSFRHPGKYGQVLMSKMLKKPIRY